MNGVKILMFKIKFWKEIDLEGWNLRDRRSVGVL